MPLLVRFERWVEDGFLMIAEQRYQSCVCALGYIGWTLMYHVDE